MPAHKRHTQGLRLVLVVPRRARL